MSQPQARSAGLDNVKGLLIFLVVLGHLLEPQSGGGVNALYLNIYAFHMPAFVFLSGWFSRKSSLKRAVTGVLLPYLVFQLIYLRYMGLPIQFTSPYWILWYLFALFVWRLLVPLLRLWEPLAWLLLPVGITASILCGYSDRIGYDFALSRILVFLPYFLAGYALSGQQAGLVSSLRRPLNRVLALLAVSGCVYYIWDVRLTFSRPWMFGAVGYDLTGATPQIRLLLLGIAVTWIWFLLSWTPERTVFGLTTLGRNTLFVYLLHGFVKLWINDRAEALYHYDAARNILLAVGLAAALCLLFGNPLLAGAWRKLTGAVRRLAHPSGAEQAPHPSAHR